MSLQLDSELFGLNPARFHLTNLIVHAGNVLLLYAALRALTGAVGRSAAAAALFAVHPLNVESVAWVAERKGLLSMFFGLVSILAYAAYVRKPNPARFAAVFVAMAVSLLCKPVFVTLPFLLLLLDYWPLCRAAGVDREGLPWRRLVVEKLPLVALAFVAGLVTLDAETKFGALPTLNNRSAYARFTNAAVSSAEYVRKLVYPSDLAPFYPHPGQDLPLGLAFGAAALLAAATVVAYRLRRRAPYLLVGWLWFLVALLPMSGLVQVGAHAMADRYAYLPMIGLLVAGCWGVGQLGLPAAAKISLFLIAVSVAALASREQVSVWRTSRALWEHTLRVTQRNYRAHFHLAYLATAEGKTHDAVEHYREGLRYHPADEFANFYLGQLLVGSGQDDEGAKHLTVATKVKPDWPDAWALLGTAYRRSGRPAEAVSALSRAVKLDPRNPIPLAERGLILAKLGQLNGAIDDFETAIGRGLETPTVHNNAGIAYAQLRRYDEARRHFEAAQRLAPDDAKAADNLKQLDELMAGKGK